MSRISRLRHVRELYTKGDVVELLDGTPLWVRALNPFEQDQARSEAQIARARMMLAVKEDGSGEHDRVRAFFFESGPDGAREILVNAKVAEQLGKITDQLRFDPEWKERLDILARGQEDTARPLEEAEKALLEKIAGEYAEEMRSRIDEERSFQESLYGNADEDKLWEDYLETYADRRGTEAAVAEHRIHQILFGTHLCDADKVDGAWNHEKCEGHMLRLFETTEEVRTTPEEVVAPILAKLAELDMSLIEAKNSDRQGSSSDSSPLPSEPEESTLSTPIETRTERIGS